MWAYRFAALRCEGTRRGVVVERLEAYSLSSRPKECRLRGVVVQQEEGDPKSWTVFPPENVY